MTQNTFSSTVKIESEREKNDILKALSRPEIELTAAEVAGALNSKQYKFKSVKMENSTLSMTCEPPNGSISPQKVFSLNFSLPEGLFFFQSPILRDESGLFVVEVVDPIYKIQRRENFRSPIPKDCRAELVLQAPGGTVTTLFRLTDLSSSGCGFEMPKSFNGLEKETTYSGRLYLLAHDGVNIQFRVKNLRPGNEVAKIGVLFENVDPATTALFSDVILEIHRKYFSSFRFLNRS